MQKTSKPYFSYLLKFSPGIVKNNEDEEIDTKSIENYVLDSF